jgi:hypothetical protein
LVFVRFRRFISNSVTAAALAMLEEEETLEQPEAPRPPLLQLQDCRQSCLLYSDDSSANLELGVISLGLLVLLSLDELDAQNEQELDTKLYRLCRQSKPQSPDDFLPEKNPDPDPERIISWGKSL